MDTENSEAAKNIRPGTKGSNVGATIKKEGIDCSVTLSDDKQYISESFKKLHVSAASLDCHDGVGSDFIENKQFSKKLPQDSTKEGGKSYSSSKHLKKKRRNRRKGSDVDACSSSGSYTDSVGFRTRQSVRNQNCPLITLSSDSGSDTNSKKPSSEQEAFSSTDKKKGKRFAHIKADYIRQLSSLHWSKQDKKASDNNSETSSNNSVIAKVRKRSKRRLINKATLARNKYLATKALRHKTLVTRKKLPFLRARTAHHKHSKLSNKTKRISKLQQQSGLSQKRPVGRPRLIPLQTTPSAHPTNKPIVLPPSQIPDGQPVKRPKGRPRKYFKFETPSVDQQKNISPNEKDESKKSSDDESSQRKQDSDKEEQNSKSDFLNAARNASLIVKKRGRSKITMSARMLNDKNIPINRKIKPFLQKTSCIDITQRISKCRECRLAAYNKGKNQNSYCRFLEFRKLCYAKNGTILNAGFSLALECTEEDRRLWLPKPDQPPADLTIETSQALLVQVGDQFCDLIEHEKEAHSLHIGFDKTITWKRIVQGIREMCDVCDTTLFNIHWVCPKCGIAVCIDCYKVRKQGIIAESEDSLSKGRDEYLWLLCNGRQPHEQDKLIMTQIIPGNVLWTMQAAMHRARELWKISAYCKCHPHNNSAEMTKHVPTGICKQLMCSVSKSFSSHPTLQTLQNTELDENNQMPKLDAEINDNAMRWLSDEKRFNSNEVTDNDSSNDGMIYGPCYESFATLKNMLLQGSHDSTPQLCPSTFLAYTIDDIIDCVMEPKVDKMKNKSEKDNIKLFNHRYPQPNSGRDPLPIRIFTTTESNIIYNDVPHSWLCNGRLLLLHQAMHSKNLELFQEQWKRGQPIMVMGVDKRLDMSLWHPDGFCRDFGEINNDLVNCKTGVIIPDLPMKKFWEGFENFDKRLKDENGDYMLLKLKDWPPGEDFSEKLPKRFHDLMRGLPLPEYTHRDGIFNLAGRLPPWFVRPDLGPKMYNAYGSALFPAKGTTNLHLDISDAVNVMVYVGVPPDNNNGEDVEEALKAIDEGGCDSLMRARVRSKGVRPGALWHIYNARDTDKIRDMLTKVAIERGEKLEAHHDPIHDQSWYIDAELRKRLYHEYGVEGYAIAQCLGDAVFIPAGAPHQVRNLHSCVKVAEDFVSPENIGHCFKLTQEFRNLSDTHTNHEDKLQIKNIIYHVVKDSLSYLLDQESAKLYNLSDISM